MEKNKVVKAVESIKIKIGKLENISNIQNVGAEYSSPTFGLYP